MKIQNIWQQIKEKLLSDNIDPIIFDNYIANASIYQIENDQCHILVSSTFAKELLTNNLSYKMESLLNKITGKKLKINFIEENEIEKIKSISFKKNEKEKKEFSFNNYSSEKKNKGKFTFTNFVKGSCNNEAYQSCIAVVNNLGKVWNPLFIYGDSGLGKTHLLHAIENEIYKLSEDINVKYLSSEEFGRQFLEIYNQGIDIIENFKESFNDYDVLLIDDIQLLARRTKTNEIFFNIFNRFIEANKQIVLTSDKYPNELNGFEQRIISRFQSGLSVNLVAPDFETALNILNLKLKELNNNFTTFDPEVLEFIAMNFNKDVRSLEGALNRLMFFSVLNVSPEKVIRLEDAKTAFKMINMDESTIGKITIKKIQNIVAEYYNISPKLLISKSRISNITIARHLAMYLSKIILDASYSKIGDEFGKKDHSTVISACQKIKKLIKENLEFANIVNKIKKKCCS